MSMYYATCARDAWPNELAEGFGVQTFGLWKRKLAMVHRVQHTGHCEATCG